MIDVLCAYPRYARGDLADALGPLRRSAAARSGGRPVRRPPGQAAVPVLKMGQQTSVRQALSSAVS